MKEAINSQYRWTKLYAEPAAMQPSGESEAGARSLWMETQGLWASSGARKGESPSGDQYRRGVAQGICLRQIQNKMINDTVACSLQSIQLARKDLI